MNLEDSKKDRDPNAKVSDSGSFILNRSENHFGRPSVMTSSILIKDITDKMKVWNVEDIYDHATLPACYAFYDKYGKLLYVGKAIDIWKRFSKHMHSGYTNTTMIKVKEKTYFLWKKFHSVQFYQLSETDAHYLEYLEQCLFHNLRPSHNIWRLGMITDDEYTKILDSSPSHDQSAKNGWEPHEKDLLKDAKANWPDKDLLIEVGIIKEGEKYDF